MERDIIPGNGALARDIHRLFLQGTVMSDPIDERYDEIQARLFGGLIFTKPLDNEGSVLWHELNRIPQNNHYKN